MDAHAARSAMAETLGSEARAWLGRWVEENRRLLPLLPRAEASALLRTREVAYGAALAMEGPPELLLGLRRLEHGDRSGVPATGVLTHLNRHLEHAIHEPAALQ